MKNTFRKITTLMLALVFTASLPLSVLALDLDVSQGSIVIDSVNATQNEIAQAHNGSVNVTQSAPTENTVTVRNAQDVQVSIQATSDLNVTLDNVSINTGETGTDADSAAISIDRAAGATVTVELNGTNTLVSDEKHAGLEVSGSGQLVIQDVSGKVNPDGSVSADGGSLTATGGTYGAGIGSQYNGENVQNITITGGTVTANGGSQAAGIGAGGGNGMSHGSGGAENITITGGTVNAFGGSSGAGIGSGYNNDTDNIVITGGTVNAKGGQQGAGIGAGAYGEVGSIAISGGTVNATGAFWSAGIGGVITDDTSISFSGDAKVTAIGGTDANHIGGSYGNPAVEPDISDLSTDGWYQAGADGEIIYGSIVAGGSDAPAQTAEGSGWFTVDAPWGQRLQDGVLTVTSGREDAVLTIKGWGIRGLHSSGIHTLVFVTANAESTLDIAKLAAECEGADVYVLTHTGDKTELTLNGEAI